MVLPFVEKDGLLASATAWGSLSQVTAALPVVVFVGPSLLEVKEFNTYCFRGDQLHASCRCCQRQVGTPQKCQAPPPTAFIRFAE